MHKKIILSIALLILYSSVDAFENAVVPQKQLLSQADAEFKAQQEAKERMATANVQQKIEKPASQMRSKLPELSAQCEHNSMHSDFTLKAGKLVGRGSVYHFFHCPPGVIPNGVPNPQCSHHKNITHEDRYTVICDNDDQEPYLESEAKAQQDVNGQKAAANTRQVPNGTSQAVEPKSALRGALNFFFSPANAEPEPDDSYLRPQVAESCRHTWDDWQQCENRFGEFAPECEEHADAHSTCLEAGMGHAVGRKLEDLTNSSSRAVQTEVLRNLESCQAKCDKNHESMSYSHAYCMNSCSLNAIDSLESQKRYLDVLNRRAVHHKAAATGQSAQNSGAALLHNIRGDMTGTRDSGPALDPLPRDADKKLEDCSKHSQRRSNCMSQCQQQRGANQTKRCDQEDCFEEDQNLRACEQNPTDFSAQVEQELSQAQVPIAAQTRKDLAECQARCASFESVILHGLFGGVGPDGIDASFATPVVEKDEICKDHCRVSAFQFLREKNQDDAESKMQAAAVNANGSGSDTPKESNPQEADRKREDCDKHWNRRKACVEACIDELGEKHSTSCAEIRCADESYNFDQCLANNTPLKSQLEEGLRSVGEQNAQFVRTKLPKCHNKCHDKHQGVLGGIFDSQVRKDRLAACKDSCDYQAADYMRTTRLPAKPQIPTQSQTEVTNFSFGTVNGKNAQDESNSMPDARHLFLSNQDQGQRDRKSYIAQRAQDNFGAQTLARAAVAPKMPVPVDCAPHIKRAESCMWDCSGKNPTSSDDPHSSRCEAECRKERQNVDHCMNNTHTMQQRLAIAERNASDDKAFVERENGRPICKAECDREFVQASKENGHDPRVAAAKYATCQDHCTNESIGRLEEDAKAHFACQMNAFLDKHDPTSVKPAVLRIHTLDNGERVADFPAGTFSEKHGKSLFEERPHVGMTGRFPVWRHADDRAILDDAAYHGALRQNVQGCQSSQPQTNAHAHQCKAKPIGRMQHLVANAPTSGVNPGQPISVPREIGLSRGSQAQSDLKKHIMQQTRDAEGLQTLKQAALQPKLPIGDRVDLWAWRKTKEREEREERERRQAMNNAFKIAFNSSEAQQYRAHAPQYRSGQTSNNIGRESQQTSLGLGGQPTGSRAQRAPTQRQQSQSIRQEALKEQAHKFKQANEELRARWDAAIQSGDTRPLAEIYPGSDNHLSNLNSSGASMNFGDAMNQCQMIAGGIASALYLMGDDSGAAQVAQASACVAQIMGGFYTGNPFAVLSGCAGLKSALEKHESNNVMMQAILDEVRALSAQVARNHEQVMKRFDRVEQILEHEQRLIITGFFNLHQETGDIKTAIKKLGEQAEKSHAQLSGQIAYAHQHMSSQLARIDDSLVAQRIEDIHEVVANALEDADKKELAEKDFARHIKRLARKATTRAAEPHLTGGDREPTDVPGLQTALRTKNRKLWEHPAFANANLLSKYAALRSKTKHTNLVNPLIWVQCASAAVQMLGKKLMDRNYPSTQDQFMSDINHLRKLLQEGEKLAESARVFDKAGIAHDVFKDYLQKMRDLSALIKDRQLSYEEERSKDLYEMHRKHAEAEANMVATTPIDCPDCVKVTEGVISQVRSNRIYPWKHQVNWQMKFREKEEPDLRAELLEVAKTTDIVNPHAKLKEVHKAREKNVLEKAATKVAMTLEDEYGDVEVVKRGGFIVYPADQENYKIRLVLDEQDLPYMYPQFLKVQKLGLGTMRYEYLIKENNFHLLMYYCANDGSKTLVRDEYIPYESSTLYNNDENVQHFWYGGRYPKDNDIFESNHPHKAPGGMARTFAKWGHYPPKAPYPGAQDLFALGKEVAKRVYVGTTTHVRKMQKQIDAFYAQERIKFCSRVAAEAEPSKSKLFKTIQEMDVQFKLLDSFLTFMYNELMFDPKDKDTLRAEFVALHDNQVTFLKDEEALNRYFEQYANPGTKLCEKEFSLADLQKTQDTMVKNFEGIMGLKLKAEFASVMSVVKGLKDMLAMYSGRAIMPVQIDTQAGQLILMQRQLDQRDKELMLRDKELTLLAQDRTRLTTVVEKTQQEIAGLRDQMKQMMEMMMKMQKQSA